MLQNKKISILYRIICFITFVLVIYKVNSFITLSLLTIAFYLFTRNEKSYLVTLWHIITIIIFLVCYLTNNYLILKIVLIIDLGYYFLNNPIILVDNISTIKESIVFNKYFIRFKDFNKKGKEVINNNLLCVVYVTVHLFILFMAIMVG